MSKTMAATEWLSSFWLFFFRRISIRINNAIATRFPYTTLS